VAYRYVLFKALEATGFHTIGNKLFPWLARTAIVYRIYRRCASTPQKLRGITLFWDTYGFNRLIQILIGL